MNALGNACLIGNMRKAGRTMERQVTSFYRVILINPVFAGIHEAHPT